MGTARLQEMAHHLLQEERVALRLPPHRLGQRRLGLVEPPFGQGAEELVHLRDGQAREKELLEAPLPAQLPERLGEWVPPGHLDLPPGPDHQQPAAGETSGQLAQQLQRRRVGPVEVLEHQDDRMDGGGVEEEGRDALHQLVARVFSGGPGRLGQVGKTLADLRDQAGDVGGTLTELHLEVLGRFLGDVSPDRLGEGEQEADGLGFVAAAGEHLGAPQTGVDPRLVDQTTLADAGFARDEGDPAPALQGCFDGRLEDPELLRPPDEPAAAADPGQALAGGERSDGRDLQRRFRRVSGDLLQAAAHDRRAGGSLIGVLGQQLEDEPAEGAGDGGVVPRGRHRLGVEVLGDERYGVASDEGRPSGEELVEQGPEGVEIGRGADLAAERLLGGHVGDGADHHPFAGDPGVVGHDRQTEVPEAGLPVLGEPDVGGLEVPVNDAAGVGVLEGGGELAGDADGVGDGQTVIVGPVEQILDGAAGHELAHDEGPALVVSDVVDGDDVGVVTEERHRLGLATDAHQPGFVQTLGLHRGQGDLAPQRRVVGGIDALAAAFTEKPPDQIAAAAERRPLLIRDP